jgi:hypothetical protein
MKNKPNVGDRVCGDGYYGTVVKVWTPDNSTTWRCIIQFDDAYKQEDLGEVVWFENGFNDVFEILVADQYQLDLFEMTSITER